MSDGLKTLAGESLKKLLGKFTGGLTTSIVSGTVVTALIQSSSATVLMVIGFVSAGLLTFSQTIGVVIGANIGSTMIGWIVSAIGFKVKMNVLALPLIGIGSFMSFFSKEKYMPHGKAIAGFGLLFLGIDILQSGMAIVTDMFRFDALGEPTVWQILLLVLIGIVMTVIMQSSSAAMVITLSALAADALLFEQAAALVIGQNIGTTVKAYVATIGGSAQSKRTAMAHILFNVIVAVIALCFLPLILSLIFAMGRIWTSADEPILLALFGTLIYVFGVLVVVPLHSWFKRLIEFIIPDRSEKLTKYLDASVAMVAPVAIEAVRRTLLKVMAAIAPAGRQLCEEGTLSRQMHEQLNEADLALQETTRFLSQVNASSASMAQPTYEGQVSLIHGIDHLMRLVKTLQENGLPKSTGNEEHIRQLSRTMAQLFQRIENRLPDHGPDLVRLVEELENNSLAIAEIRRQNRRETFATTVSEQMDAAMAIEQVHALHWYDRAAYHLWRGMHYLRE